MATAAETEPLAALDVTVPARAAAIAWLNAFLAASQDEHRHALYRTIALELFDTGVQLVGCDGTALFRTWVPCDGTTAWPGNYARPLRKIVVMDPEHFGKGFMQTLVRVTGQEEYAGQLLTFSTGAYDLDATPALGSAFQSERLTIRACGQRMDLRLYEGEFPNWRAAVLDTHRLERVDGLKVAGRLMALLGKIRGVGGVDLDFQGKDRGIGFTAHGEGEVRGVIMPMYRAAKPEPDEEE